MFWQYWQHIWAPISWSSSVTFVVTSPSIVSSLATSPVYVSPFSRVHVLVLFLSPVRYDPSSPCLCHGPCLCPLASLSLGSCFVSLFYGVLGPFGEFLMGLEANLVLYDEKRCGVTKWKWDVKVVFSSRGYWRWFCLLSVSKLIVII